MADSLSSLSTKFRESLLKRNLTTEDIRIPGLGYTREPGEYNSNSESSLNISNTNALKSHLAYNRYTFGEVLAVQGVSDPIMRYNSSETYLDKYDLGSEETGKIKSFNMIGSILNGTGVGWNGSGFEDTFDVRTTLAGRILSATGVINDTPLGMIANKELVKAMTNRVMFNTQRETFGRLNIDPINAIKGGDIIRPDYSITTGYDFLTKGMEVLEDLTGINLPFSQLSPDAHISNPQALIKNSGRGQVKELFFNLAQNRLGPKYQDDRIKNISLENNVDYSDTEFGSIKESSDDYDTITAGPTSLLGQTQWLFKDRNFAPLHRGKAIMMEDSEVSNGVKIGGTTYMSKGSGVLNESGLRGVPDENGNVFGRVFTKDDPYKFVKNIQKRTGLAYKDSASDSVLDSNGFIRVGPNKNDIMEGREGNIKNFMFSIENLAWHDSDNLNSLSPSEVGPGDLVTGTRGRIMWFPPYDISFSEVTTVNWETTTFIGRGEPIYTYNNTERVGSLDFKVIMDYPGYMEDLKGKASDELFRAIAAGVQDVDYTQFKNLSPNTQRDLELGTNVQPTTLMDSGQIEPEDFELYFDHNVSNPLFVYEPDGLNSHFTEDFIPNLQTQLIEQCPACTLYIKGYGSLTETEEIARDRADRLRTYLSSQGITKNKIFVSSENYPQLIGCDTPNENSECKKRARKAHVTFAYDPAANEENNSFQATQTNIDNRDLSSTVKKRFLNEALFFEKLSVENPLVYESISESIKYFHPAFHSITPEGFSSRLNFLQQCTRQGPTQGEGIASNLSFGKPPVCILRVGDFYHTKIIIDSVNLSFEDHQWDLNPEGAGIQPMIAKVSLSFRFIGGSSLKGPINKLQNAVAFNFFANTEIYDDRAIKIVKRDDGTYKYSDEIDPQVRKDYGQDMGITPNQEIIATEPIIEGGMMPPQKKFPTDEDLFKNLIYTYNFKTFNPPEGETEEMSFTFQKRQPIIIETPMKIKIKVLYNITGEEFNLEPIDLSDDMVDGVTKTWRTYPKRLNVPYSDWSPEKGPALILHFSYKGMNKMIEFPTMDYGV